MNGAASQPAGRKNATGASNNQNVKHPRGIVRNVILLNELPGFNSVRVLSVVLLSGACIEVCGAPAAKVSEFAFQYCSKNGGRKFRAILMISKQFANRRPTYRFSISLTQGIVWTQLIQPNVHTSRITTLPLSALMD